MSVYKGGSILLYGNENSYIDIQNDEDLRFGTGDFTLEWFQYQTDKSTHPRPFSIGYNDPPTQPSFAVSLESNIFYAWMGSSAINMGSITNYKNQWEHFALTRESGTLRAFRNGIQLNGGDIANTSDLNNTTDILRIGNESVLSTQSSFGGYITNFHWVKGLAKYTSNFTAPTSPFQPENGGETKILLKAITPNTLLEDSGGSIISKTITNEGSQGVVWNSLSPFTDFILDLSNYPITLNRLSITKAYLENDNIIPDLDKFTISDEILNSIVSTIENSLKASAGKRIVNDQTVDDVLFNICGFQLITKEEIQSNIFGELSANTIQTIANSLTRIYERNTTFPFELGDTYLFNHTIQPSNITLLLPNILSISNDIVFFTKNSRGGLPFTISDDISEETLEGNELIYTNNQSTGPFYLDLSGDGFPVKMAFVIQDTFTIGTLSVTSLNISNDLHISGNVFLNSTDISNVSKIHFSDGTTLSTATGGGGGGEFEVTENFEMSNYDIINVSNLRFSDGPAILGSTNTFTISGDTTFSDYVYLNGGYNEVSGQLQMTSNATLGFDGNNVRIGVGPGGLTGVDSATIENTILLGLGAQTEISSTIVINPFFDFPITATKEGLYIIPLNNITGDTGPGQRNTLTYNPNTFEVAEDAFFIHDGQTTTLSNEYFEVNGLETRLYSNVILNGDQHTLSGSMIVNENGQVNFTNDNVRIGGGIAGSDVLYSIAIGTGSTANISNSMVLNAVDTVGLVSTKTGLYVAPIVDSTDSPAGTLNCLMYDVDKMITEVRNIQYDGTTTTLSGEVSIQKADLEMNLRDIENVSSIRFSDGSVISSGASLTISGNVLTNQKLSIGTTLTDNQLTLSGVLQLTNYNLTSENEKYGLYSYDNVFQINPRTSTGTYRSINGFVMDSSGRIGIGQLTPTKILDLSGTFNMTSGTRTGDHTHADNSPFYATGDIGAVSAGFQFGHINGTTGVGIGSEGIYMAGSATNLPMSLVSKGTGKLFMKPGGTTVGTLTSTGLGLGTETPGSQVHIVKGSNYPEIAVQYTPGGQVGIIGSGTAGVHLGYSGYLVLGSCTGVQAGGFTERFRFTTTGRLGIGSTSPNALLNLNGGGNRLEHIRIDGINQPGIYFYNTGSGGKAWNIWATATGDSVGAGHLGVYNQSDGLYLLTLLSTGTIRLNSYTTNGNLQTSAGNGTLVVSSDVRVKKNITYPELSGLHIINQLKPAKFQYNHEETDYHLGFIAQDVEVYLPEAIDGKKHPYEFLYEEVDIPSPEELSYETPLSISGEPISVSNDISNHHYIKKFILKLNEDGTPMYDYSKPRYRGLDHSALIATLVKAVQEVSSTKDTHTEILNEVIQSKIYRGKTILQNSQTTLNLDNYFGYVSGTFQSFTNSQVFLRNHQGWSSVKGHLSGSELIIIAQDTDCQDEIDFMIVCDETQSF
jgi:hypothetical protein